ncbi:hypothetical protein [Streptacidiphilus neutrinimicus]|uniref:hypothetical protein n=1 Tax=Streptacidiphilus neutrinimicus TaxID=105420 RepID=UPI0005AA2D2D|nr:hypothetical protein [Streptacidiphilus neutrinimicus]
MSSEHAVPDSGAILAPATGVTLDQIGILSLSYRAGIPVLRVSGGHAMPATLLLVNEEDQVLGRYEAVLRQPVMRSAGYLGFAKGTPGITEESALPPLVVSEGTGQADPVGLDEVLET